jgi:hypothetical protein
MAASASEEVVAASSSASAAPLATAPAPSLPALDPASARRGVVVLAIGDASDAAWPVALAVYGDGSLRPKIADADARALAGAEPAKDAPKGTRELSELRAQVKGDDAASRLLLAEIARRTAALAVVLVFPKSDAAPAQARVYDAADGAVEATLHRESASGGWSGLLGTLRGRYARTPVDASANATTTATDPKAAAAKPSSGGSILKSPWFWGAIGAAVLGGVVIAVAARGGDAQTSTMRVEWSR